MTNTKLGYILLALVSISLSFGKELKPDLESITYEAPPNIIEFKKDSLNLEQEGKKKIDRLLKFMIELTKYDQKPSFDSRDTSLYTYKVGISLSPICCMEEYTRNKFIGVQRAAVIAGYIERKFAIPKSDIEITDKSCKSDEYEKCSKTGIYLNLTRR